MLLKVAALICGTLVRNDIVRGYSVGDAKIVWTGEREQIELSWYRLCLKIKAEIGEFVYGY